MFPVGVPRHVWGTLCWLVDLDIFPSFWLLGNKGPAMRIEPLNGLAGAPLGGVYGPKPFRVLRTGEERCAKRFGRWPC
jgi:hypothetical protein